jgi:hypothetical protein
MIETRAAAPTPPAMPFETNPLLSYPLLIMGVEEEVEDEALDELDDVAAA